MHERPRFNTLWTGPWPHKRHEGVGLYLFGMPNDPQRFIEMMMGYSCHPKAGQRIVNRLFEHGEDRLTVMFALDFDEIARKMKEFGVVMKIIAPQPGWEPRFPKEEWTPEQMHIANQGGRPQ